MRLDPDLPTISIHRGLSIDLITLDKSCGLLSVTMSYAHI